MDDKINLKPGAQEAADTQGEGNHLFPIFLKLENLSLLIVGGGQVALEKLSAVLQNSPSAKVRLVATNISDDIRNLVLGKTTIELIERPYQKADMATADLVIAAVNDITVSLQVTNDAKEKGKLVNAADKPDLCDFYLGSIVQKGNLKIAISTNGKSPTIAKRMKEVLNETLPDEINTLLDNMQNIRNKMSGDFAEKVRQLNEITRKLSQE